MPIEVNLQPTGLYTHPSDFVSPKGALRIARNINIDKEGTATTRRGFKQYLTGFAANVRSIAPYDGVKIISDGSALYYDAAGVLTSYSGTYNEPDTGIRVQYVEASKNLYFNTASGVYKIDDYTNEPSSAGMVRALSGTVALFAGVVNWMPANSQVAYRVVWGIRDANDNLVDGAPSDRMVLVNPAAGAASSAQIIVYIPSGITTSHFVQVYRSLTTASDAIVPNDELGLVYEASPSAGDITAGFMTITDETPEDLRGAIIYTAQSQEGILNANDPPPYCRDMAYFKDCMCYAGTRQKQNIQITLISASAFGIGSSILLAGLTYTGTAATEDNNGNFIVYLAGTVGENIEKTAQSLVRAVNLRTANTSIYAYYVSGYNDLPGKMVFQERGSNGAVFGINANAGGFSPDIFGVTVNSSAEDGPNRIYYSKPGQPEAVPSLNWLAVGSANQKILKIVALRESVIIFKQNEIYRMYGTDPSNFTITLVDNTANIRGSATAAVFNNRAFVLTNQGVCAVTDAGVEVISRPIEADLLKYLTADYTATDDISFAVGYQSDRKYLLWLPKTTTDTVPQFAYVFNAFTNAWTTWDFAATAGVVDPVDDKLYLGTDSLALNQEKKDLVKFDHSDGIVSVTVTNSYPGRAALNSTSGINIGDAIRQGTKWATITDIISLDVLLDNNAQLANGTALVERSIQTEVEFKPTYCEAFGMIKRFREVLIHARDTYFKKAMIAFKTNFTPITNPTELTPSASGGWGRFPWGKYPWGSNSIGDQTIRTYVTREHSRGQWIALNFKVDYPYSNMGLTGFTLVYEPYDTRQK